MDPFRLCLALGPVAVYLLLIGAINLSRRPFLVGGTRDAAALGLAVAGLAMIGPLEMFCPPSLAAKLGPYTWLVLLGVYGVLLVSLLLTLRPRLIVYNLTADELRPVLADLVPWLDAEARWAGDCLCLPRLGVQLSLATVYALRNVSLAAVGVEQNPAGWRTLEQALRRALAQIEVRRNRAGLHLTFLGLAVLTALVWEISRDPESVYQALFEMFQW